MNSSMLILLSWIMLLVLLSKITIDFSLSCNSFTFLHFIFRSMTHFFLVNGTQLCVYINSFACGYPVVLAPFLEMTTSFLLNCLFFYCQRSFDCIYLGLFLEFAFCPVDLSVLLLISSCNYYSIFILSLKVRYCESSYTFLCLQYYYDYFVSFAFP